MLADRTNPSSFSLSYVLLYCTLTNDIYKASCVYMCECYLKGIFVVGKMDIEETLSQRLFQFYECMHIGTNVNTIVGGVLLFLRTILRNFTRSVAMQSM